MSEYQYYEFQALDKPLDEGALRYLRKLSTRASITRTSLINVYHFGDFRGNPRVLMEKYFDAFVYVANWGTNELMFRFPRDVVDVKTLASYCVDDCLSVWTTGRHAILHYNSHEEGADWDGGEDWLTRLIPVRNDILKGDMRGLYLGWLAGLTHDDADDTAREPPVPAGLRNLTGGQKALAEFLRIDDTLLEAAAAPSPELGVAPWKARLRDRISSLSAADKDSLILKVMQSEAPNEVQAELLHRFKDEPRPGVGPGSRGARTGGDILAEVHRIDLRKQQEAAAKEERERKRREQKLELARAKRLDALAPKQSAAWREVEDLIDSRQPQSYAEAVRLLQDLQALALRETNQEAFDKRIRALRERHGRKRTLMARLDQAGL